MLFGEREWARVAKNLKRRTKKEQHPDFILRLNVDPTRRVTSPTPLIRLSSSPVHFPIED